MPFVERLVRNIHLRWVRTDLSRFKVTNSILWWFAVRTPHAEYYDPFLYHYCFVVNLMLYYLNEHRIWKVVV